MEELLIHRWFENEFITASTSKSRPRPARRYPPRLTPHQVLRALQDAYLVRSDTRLARLVRTQAHAVLADRPLALFITAQPTDLMEEALCTAGEEPQRELCRWKEGDN